VVSALLWRVNSTKVPTCSPSRGISPSRIVVAGSEMGWSQSLVTAAFPSVRTVVHATVFSKRAWLGFTENTVAASTSTARSSQYTFVGFFAIVFRRSFLKKYRYCFV